MIGSSKSVWGFDPRSVPGCQLWLDGADTTTLTLSGSTVTQWKDKSGNVKNTTSYAGTPTLNTSAINGRQAITLNGSSSFTGSITGSGNTLTVCIVGIQGSGCATDGGLLCFGRPGYSDWQDSGSFTIEEGQLSGSMFSTRASLSTQRTTTGVNTPFIYILIFDGNYANTYTNGTFQSSTSSSGSFAYTEYKIGTRAGNTGDTFWTGFIGEALVYSSALTSSERQQVEGYLAHKWGLTPPSSTFPLTIPGCRLWLDAADTSSLTLSGSTVTQWRDKSGLGNSPTVYSGVSYSTGQQNSLGTVNLGNYSGSMTGTITPPLQNSVMSCFFVFKLNATSDNNGSHSILLFPNPGSGDLRTLEERKGNFRFLTFNPSVALISTPAVAGSYVVWFSGQNTTNMYARLNGTPLTPVSISTNAINSSQYGIGTNFETPLATPTGWNGYVAEMIVYNSLLSVSQQQEVETYLAKKWGIWSTPTIPSSHPFYSIRPHLRTFNPTDVPGCQLWLDAADSSSLVLSGSSVTTWNDKSGNGYHMNTLPASAGWSGTAAYPTIGTSINGLQTVNFLAQSGLKQSTTLDGVKNLFWVGRIAAPDGTAAGGNSCYFLLGHDNLFDWHSAIYRGGFVDVNAQGGISYAIANLFTSDPTAVTNTTFLNVIMPSPPSISLLSVTGITGTTRYQGICYDRNTHTGWCGDLAEVLIYSTALTTSQRQQVEGYLAHKWGLTPTIQSTHPFSKFPPASLPFSPRNISGVTLWLDAADQTSITLSGSSVTQMNDKSGNGYNSTAGGTTPTYSSATRSIVFGGAGYFTNSSLSLPLSTRSVFIVCRQTSRVADFEGIMLLSSPSLGDVDYDSATTIPYFASGSNVVVGDTAFSIYNRGTYVQNYRPYVLTPLGIYVDVFGSSSGTLYVNGTSNSTVADSSGLGTANGYILGARKFSGTTLSTFLNGTINEILVFNSVLTTSERQKVEGYLAWKWGLTGSLPAGHPYKTVQP